MNNPKNSSKIETILKNVQKNGNKSFVLYTRTIKKNTEFIERHRRFLTSLLIVEKIFGGP